MTPGILVAQSAEFLVVTESFAKTEHLARVLEPLPVSVYGHPKICSRSNGLASLCPATALLHAYGLLAE